MRKTFISLFVALLVAQGALAGECDQAGSCAGGVVWPCYNEYNHLYNWRFDASCEWSYSNAYRSQDHQMCEGTFESPGYAHLDPGLFPTTAVTSKVWQNVTVFYPTNGLNNFIVGYNIEMEDPNANYDNTAQVRVYKNGTLIATGTTHRGSQTDPQCTRYQININQDLSYAIVKVELRTNWNPPYTNGVPFANFDNITLTQACNGACYF